VPELPEEFILPVASASGTCNAYLPSGPSTLPRYLWVIQYLVANGLYVMVRGGGRGGGPGRGGRFLGAGKGGREGDNNTA
jgi:hypothetical protein